MARITVSGLHELEAKLRALPRAVAEHALRPAVAAAARVLRDEASRLAPMYTGPVADGHPPPGTLKRSIFQTYVRQRSSPSRVVYAIGVRHGGSGLEVGDPTGKGAFYWHMVEYGTVKMAAQPYLRPAFEAAADQAYAVMKKRLAEEISKEAAK